MQARSPIYGPLRDGSALYSLFVPNAASPLIHINRVVLARTIDEPSWKSAAVPSAASQERRVDALNKDAAFLHRFTKAKAPDDAGALSFYREEN